MDEWVTRKPTGNDSYYGIFYDYKKGKTSKDVLLFFRFQTDEMSYDDERDETGEKNNSPKERPSMED